MQNDDKRLAALAAVAEIRDGMLVGLGTGSTAAHAIAAIGARVAEGMQLTAVATSQASAAQARSLGIRVLAMEDVAAVDLTIDGADEIDGLCRAVKGAGGAMVREKIVAAASARMVVIADGSKRVDRIGAAKLPVEVLPFALSFVAAALERLGAAVEVRRTDGAVVATDNGNMVLDARFAAMADPAALAAALDATPGVVGHGLFLQEVDAAYVATGGVVVRLERPAACG